MTKQLPLPPRLNASITAFISSMARLPSLDSTHAGNLVSETEAIRFQKDLARWRKLAYEHLTRFDEASSRYAEELRSLFGPRVTAEWLNELAFVIDPGRKVATPRRRVVGRMRERGDGPPFVFEDHRSPLPAPTFALPPELDFGELPPLDPYAALKDRSAP